MDENRDNVLAYHCPTCGAALAFDPVSGKLKCGHCESEYVPEEMDRALQDQQATEMAGAAEGGFRAYSCTDCGAELMADENTAVIQCPYCGNNTIATAQFAGAIRPNSVIPFGITKDQAIEKYKEYYKKGMKKLLLPGSFQSESHVQEIQGVYIPFWLYNGNASIQATYDASNSHQEGDYEIIEHYKAEREGNMDFENVPADASKRMADDLMDSIEPYDFKAIKPFAMSYLPGFLAERFDVNEQDNKKRAQDRIKKTISMKTRETVKYDSIDGDHENIQVKFGKTKYALLPAWLLTTKWNDKEYTFAMNAQTGKFTGNLPISGAKFALLALLSFLIVCLPVVFAASVPAGIIAGLIVAGIVSLIAHGSMKPVSQAGNANQYMDDKVKLTRKNDTFIRKERKHNPQKKDN